MITFPVGIVAAAAVRACCCWCQTGVQTTILPRWARCRFLRSHGVLTGCRYGIAVTDQERALLIEVRMKQYQLDSGNPRASAALAPNATCSYMPGVDLYGHDIRGAPALRASECCAICAKEVFGAYVVNCGGGAASVAPLPSDSWLSILVLLTTAAQ